MTGNHKHFFNEPILNHNDFIRLIHNGAWSYLTRRKGIPPTLPSIDECSTLPMSSFQIKELTEFHSIIKVFFGLGGEQEPNRHDIIGEYAKRLTTSWQNGKREIIFHTSGSTGEPRPSRHSEEMLRQEMLETANLFKMPKRVMVTVPLLHSYGFVFGLLLPKVLEIPAIDIPPLPTVIFENLKKSDLVVGFPLIFSRLEASPEPDIHLLSSTAPCPDPLFKQMNQKGYELAEVYGSSETGAMAVRFAANSFRLLSYWHKKDKDHLLRELPPGQDMIWPLPDHLRWYDQIRFRPTGRKDLAVQVAGVNVYPGRVASIIKEHPGVKDCSVRLMKPEEGDRLKAFVAIKPNIDQAELRKELNTLLKSKLSPPERPGSITFGLSLPRTMAGKSADWPIDSDKTQLN